MCSSLEVRITSDEFRLPELPGTQWPAYVWECQLLWHTHTHTFYIDNEIDLTLKFPSPFFLQQLSVQSGATQKTKLMKISSRIGDAMEKYWFSKTALKLTEHCPLVPLGSQVFSALYRINRDASCMLRDLKKDNYQCQCQSVCTLQKKFKRITMITFVLTKWLSHLLWSTRAEGTCGWCSGK